MSGGREIRVIARGRASYWGIGVAVGKSKKRSGRGELDEKEMQRWTKTANVRKDRLWSGCGWFAGFVADDVLVPDQ